MSSDVKLRAVSNLEELIIYASLDKEQEEKALSYIDDINEYIDKYTGWNLVEATDSIKGYTYSYVTNRVGTPFIDINSVKSMLSDGVSLKDEGKIYSKETLSEIKDDILNNIRSKIKHDNADCSLLVNDDDTITYGDLFKIIEDVFYLSENSENK